MEVKNSGIALYPIAIIIIGSQTTINLEEFDDLLRKMVEFRVNYEKECRNITEEIKEDNNFWGEEDNLTEEEQAYEAERIARELEEEFHRDEERAWEERQRADRF